jgi:hypothetical protein
MPIAEHRQWCSILRGQQEMQRAAAGRADARPGPASTAKG